MAGFEPTDARQPYPSDSISEAHALLSNERRRFVLRLLRRQSTATVDALAEALVRREVDRDRRRTEDPASAVANWLHHAHLPKLEEAGLVTYDRDRRRVTLRDDDSSLQELVFPLLDVPRAERLG